MTYAGRGRACGGDCNRVGECSFELGMHGFSSRHYSIIKQLLDRGYEVRTLVTSN